MAFFTIQPVPGLTGPDVERAIEAGPPHTRVATDHELMLATVGLELSDAIDVTEGYHTTQRAWRDAWQGREPEVVAAVGQEMYDERMREREATLEAIAHKLLARTLYRATRAR